MLNDEWKWRLDRVRTDPRAQVSASPWAVDLCGPLGKSDGGKTARVMNMPASQNECPPPYLIVNFGTKRSDGC